MIGRARSLRRGTLYEVRETGIRPKKSHRPAGCGYEPKSALGVIGHGAQRWLFLAIMPVQSTWYRVRSTYVVIHGTSVRPLHKRESQLSSTADDGTITDRRIATSREWFTAVLGGAGRAARLLLEASTEREWVARHLESLGHDVIMADPNDAPMYANRSRRTKTDTRPLRAHLEEDVMSDQPTNTLPRWPSSPAWFSTADECGHHDYLTTTQQSPHSPRATSPPPPAPSAARAWS